MPRPKNRRRKSALTVAQRRQLASRLEARRAELHKPRTQELYPQLAGEVPDAGDASVAVLLTDLGHAENGRNLGELRAVSNALSRLSADDYGLCVKCGGEIPFERLRTQPTAQRCVRCQSMHEKTHAGFGAGATL